MKILFALLLVLMTTPASAQWSVEYFTRGDATQATQFYGPGTYELLKGPDYIPVYLRRENFDFIGMYGGPAQGFPQAQLPDTFPAITFTGLYDQAVVTPVVGAPELSVVRAFTKHLGGRQLNGAVNPMLQRMTTWGAATLLRAPSHGYRIYLPKVTLEVQEWCSGINTMKWLFLLALGVALVTRARLPFALAGLAHALVLGIVLNILRVAGIGYGFEKVLLSWTLLSLGVLQVTGFGWVVRR
jgi:exosortase/archaeosortase family protein